MKFHTLVLEGDKSSNRIDNTPSRNKSDYLRRKKLANMPPLYNRSFHLCRMIEEELKGREIDGSGKITLCAHNNRLFPGDDKYICDGKFGVSIYYLEKEEISALESGGDEVVIWKILKNSLLDIARRSNCPRDTLEKMQEAFKNIENANFLREEKIGRLSKKNKDRGITANVYRVLSARAGEGWYVIFTDKKGNTLCRETIGRGTKYVNRLDSRLYAKAEWRGDSFVILERFGKAVYEKTY